MLLSSPFVPLGPVNSANMGSSLFRGALKMFLRFGSSLRLLLWLNFCDASMALYLSKMLPLVSLLGAIGVACWLSFSPSCLLIFSRKASPRLFLGLKAELSTDDVSSLSRWFWWLNISTRSLTDFLSPPPSCESTSLACYKMKSLHFRTYLILIFELVLNTSIRIASFAQRLEHGNVLGYWVTLLWANCFFAFSASSLTAINIFSSVFSFFQELRGKLVLLF